MTTTWSPRMHHGAKRQWLLTNGDVVTEPDLEETASGRKVRVASAPHLSAFSARIDELLCSAVQHIAQQKGAAPWLRLDNTALLNHTLGYSPEATRKVELHVTRDDRTRGSATPLWWKFRHPEMPVEAYVTVTMTDEGPYGRSETARPQRMAIELAAPSLRPKDFRHPVIRKAASLQVVAAPDDYETRTRVDDLAKQATWTSTVALDNRLCPSERAAVKQMLTSVQQIESLDEIQIVDLAHGELMSLELVDTNVNAALVADLQDYLDNAPTVDEAVNHYQAMLAALRTAGMVLEGRTANDFLAALVSGDKSAITMAASVNAEHGAIDHDHRVVIHLPTGTIAVECSIRAQGTDRDAVADAWEKSLAVASLTGQEDALLAYARKYVLDSERERTKQIIEQRKVAEPA